MIGPLLKKNNCLNYNLRIQELFRQEFGNRRSPFRLYTIGLHSFFFIYDSMSSLIPLILQNRAPFFAPSILCAKVSDTIDL